MIEITRVETRLVLPLQRLDLGDGQAGTGSLFGYAAQHSLILFGDNLPAACNSRLGITAASLMLPRMLRGGRRDAEARLVQEGA